MTNYHLSLRAAADLEEIADYTIETFGIAQARRYREGLETCFRRLADNPHLGPPVDRLAPGLRRYAFQSHVVFYKSETKRPIWILVVRVLHKRRDVERHL
ncbi:MAG: type II toxin-antitoxin system RelE/ParE family toxin [Pseudomonadota bacterium]